MFYNLPLDSCASTEPGDCALIRRIYKKQKGVRSLKTIWKWKCAAGLLSIKLAALQIQIVLGENPRCKKKNKKRQEKKKEKGRKEAQFDSKLLGL